MLLAAAVLLISALPGAAQSVDALIRDGKYADAVAPLERMVRERPKDSEALLALGICYSQTGRPAEAVSMLRRHVTLTPRSADGRAVLGIMLLSLGRAAEARPELEQAVRLDSSQTEAIKALARAYNLLGEPAKAVVLLRPMADDEARLLLGQALLKVGDAEAAADTFERLLEAKPESPPELYIAAATARKSLKQTDQAFAIVERGMQAHPYAERLESFYAALPIEVLGQRTEERVKRLGPRPNDVRELIALGRIMINLKRSQSTGAADFAEQLLARAVALAPRDPLARYFYARSLLVMGKPEDAVAEFHRAMALSPGAELSVLIHTWCGFAQGRLKRADAADQEFRAAMETNRRLPRHMVTPAFQYFQFLKDSGSDEAWAVHDEVLRWEPYYAPALLERAKRLAAQGRQAEAAREAELALHNVEDDFTLLKALHFFLATTYHRLNRPEQAKAHADWIRDH